MPDRRRIGCLLFLALAVLAAILGWREYQRLVRTQPELFPWTPLSLADPVGRFTAAKLIALRDQPGQCRALLAAAGAAHREAKAVRPAEPACGYDEALELGPAGQGDLRYAPTKVVTSCPVAAALFLWERDVVQPAAERLLGERIARIDHFGTYSCRRLNGRPDGAFSEHATANAIDIAGFRTAAGRRITVIDNWQRSDVDAAFLREVRSGACELFATTLSPDYNAAHADHLHLDQAVRGKSGWRACR